MWRLVTIAVASGFLLLPATSAQAGSPDGPGPWTDAFEPGQTNITIRTDGSGVPPPRNNPQNAVGPAETPGGLDSPATPATAFTSLGLGGEVTLRFDNPACNVKGSDVVLDVREVTFAPPDPNYPEETARVLVSEDGTNYIQAASKINRDATVNMPAGVDFVRYVKIIDTTNPMGYIGRPTPGDGIDIDGVRAVNTANCGRFTCRASAARITNPSPSPILVEPSVSNDTAGGSGGQTCADDADTGADFSGLTPAGVSASGLTSSTDASPTNPPATADAGVLSSSIAQIPSRTGVMQAHAEANCQAGSPFPTLTGSSFISNANINGTQVVNLTTPMTIPVASGIVYLNRQQTVAIGGETRLIVRAFEYDSMHPTTPGLNVVFGEAIADFEGEPCPG